MQRSIDITKFKTCPNCGADVSSPEMKEKYSYSLFGWYMWSQGSTVVPKKITFRCTKCNIIVDKVTDKKLIEYYINHKLD